MNSALRNLTMPIKDIFDRYLLDLRATPFDAKTEHTDRAALQALLQAVADVGASGVGVHHEPKRVVGKGAPDFKVTKGGRILGYVENKPVGEKSRPGSEVRSNHPLQGPVDQHRADRLSAIYLDQQDGIQGETMCHGTTSKSPR